MGDQESVSLHRWLVFALALSLCIGLGFADGMAQPKGQMIIAVDFSLAPTFFEPAEPPTMGTPCVFLRCTMRSSGVTPLTYLPAPSEDMHMKE